MQSKKSRHIFRRRNVQGGYENHGLKKLKLENETLRKKFEDLKMTLE